jgi:hypothetical protein
MNLRHAILAALAAAATVSAPAQEAGFKLVAGTFSGAEAAGLGQDRNFGLAVYGKYFVTAKDSVEIEGGFRYNPGADVPEKTTGNPVYSYRMRTYYFGATYRRKIWFDGFFVQGGLRVSRSEVQEDITDPTGATAPQRLMGSSQTSTGPTLGIGYVLDERYTLTLGAASLKAQNAAGATKSGTVMELSLLIRM